MFKKTQLLPHPLILLSILLISSCHQTDHTDHPEYFNPVIKRSSTLSNNGQFEAGRALLDSAFYAFPDPAIGDKVLRFDWYRDYYSKIKQQYDTALMYTDSMADVLKGHEKDETYRISYMKSLLYKGDMLFALKKYTEAYQHYFKANLIAEKIDPKSYIELYLARIGRAYYKQGRYREAIGYFKKSVEVASKLNIEDENMDRYPYTRTLGFLNNIGVCYEKLGINDSALYYYKAAHKVLNDYERFRPADTLYTGRLRGLIDGNIGGTLYAQGKVKAAEQYLIASMHINSRPGYDNRDAQTAMLKLANLYIEHNRLEEAKGLLTDIRLSLDSLPNDERMLNLYKLCWNYYDKTGNTLEAYQYLQKYQQKKTFMTEKDPFFSGSDVTKEFENIQRQYEVELLREENRSKGLRLWFAFCISVLGITVTVLLWKNWRQSKINVSKLTALNRQINDQNIQLEQSNQDKDRMMKVIAHDLRNPLSGIASVTQLLLNDKNISGTNAEMIELISKSSQYANTMINDMVEATLNNQPETFKPEKTDLNLLISQCAKLLKFKADEKEQTLIVEPSDKLALTIDAEKIQRVINNLIVNAVKFTHRGGTIKIGLQRLDQAVRFYVSDTGIGVPDNIKETIFDMFTDAKRYGTSREKPFGLGLGVSKHIMEMHGGKIWVESDAGKGSTFIAELPLR